LTRRTLLLSGLAAAALPLAAASDGAPAPYGALPSRRQLRWHNLETYSFLHFTVNTFTDREWGEGDEDPNVFHPTAFDPDSIAETLKDSGMKAVILTCKHHDGFCLWPTETTKHSIRSSSWRNGKGDVVKDISEAARRRGLLFGVYLSPWDRNNAAYGTPAYIPLYRRQLTELLTNYGPIFEVWFDGANGGSGYYGGARETRTIDKTTYYDWPDTWAIVRKLQPQAVIFSDAGPDIRWVGNEKGFAAPTCWETYTPRGEHGGPAVPGDVDTRQSITGTVDGADWMPPECDVSIRPGWFWHASENDRVRTPDNLMDLYFKSVGRGASLLLNVPPDRQGRIYKTDAESLREFGRRREAMLRTNLASRARITASNPRANNRRFGPENLIDSSRETYWTTNDDARTAEVVLEFQAPVAFDVVRMREALPLGQRVRAFSIEAADEGGVWKPIASETSVGNCRLIRLENKVTSPRVKLTITQAAACPALSEFGLFLES
jgi:alpha-L-fucosidase